jgi:hypothetical protein
MAAAGVGAALALASMAPRPRSGEAASRS